MINRIGFSFFNFNKTQDCKLDQHLTRQLTQENKEKRPALSFKPSQDTFIKKQDLSFSGLTNKLSQKIYSPTETISEEAQKDTKSNGIVGNIPASWVKPISVNEREQRIKEFYKDVAPIIVEFRENTTGPGFYKQDEDVIKAKTQEAADIASEKLTKAMQKAGMLKENEKVELKEQGSGFFGRAYLIKKGDEKKYVIKIFKDLKRDKTNKEYGNYLEINRAAFWQKQACKKTNRPVFNFADINSGYMVTSLIDINSPRPKNLQHHIVLGLYPKDDNGKNLVYGYYVDFGGLMKSCDILTSNKTARFVYDEMFYTPQHKRLDKFNEILMQKNKPNYVDKLIGLVCSANLLDRKVISENVMKLADIKNNRLKLVLADEFRLVKYDDHGKYFEKIMDGADEEVQLFFATIIEGFSLDNYRKFFKQMYESCNDNVKEVLAKRINSDISGYAFKKFLKEEDPRFKEILAEKISTLPDKLKLFYYTKLLDGANSKIKVFLAKDIYRFPKEDKLKAFDMIMTVADNEVISALCKNINEEKDNDFKYYFIKQLANVIKDKNDKWPLVDAARDMLLINVDYSKELLDLLLG